MNIAWASNLPDELSLRVGPLRTAWEARGPGLLATIAKHTGPGFLPDATTVVPVHPISGDGGSVDLEGRKVTVEAVLTNRYPNLPEVLHLAWLLAQLGIPQNENVDRTCWRFGLVPVVLAAGEEVELARCDKPTIACALNAWGLTATTLTDFSADRLLLWWTPIRAGTVSLHEGVAQLQREADPQFNTGVAT